MAANSNNDTALKVVHIVGARPQFIKMAAVCRAISDFGGEELGLGARGIQSIIAHTGQHYDENMSELFFRELGIPRPRYNLKVGSGAQGAQTGKMLIRIEEVLAKEQPHWVIVYGDTNSTLAGALAGAKMHIPVAHVEAGLRSYNREMPEEINRVLTDHVSALLFCPTETAVATLKTEGLTNIVDDGKLAKVDAGRDFSASCLPLVMNVGDVMYDALLFGLTMADKRSTILNDLGLLTEDSEPRPYCLATIHRAENTDKREKLKSVFEALNEIGRNGIELIVPLHPRTHKALKELGVADYERGVSIKNPVSYFDMLILEKHARIIFTDSGGMQKEAYFLKVPCVTLREETEWPETLEDGWNILAGTRKDKILQCADKTSKLDLSSAEKQSGSFGDGRAAERITKNLALCGKNV
jgi:UDP-N-acetylglucosamine 2-epimerase